MIQQQHHSDIESRIRDTEGVHEALRRSVNEAIRQHLRAGRRIPVWREGRVVWVTPDIDHGQAGDENDKSTS